MDLVSPIVIAIDGFSSCGKSTFAKLIAKKLNYVFIDTGAMYRAVAHYGLESGNISGKQIDKNKLVSSLGNISIGFKRNSESQIETYLNGDNIEKEIRGVEISELVSEVSKIKEVREFLVHLQQEMGKKKGIVMDGRDIGTVVFPDAELKLFMTADAEVRAKRRFDELTAKGLNVSYDEIKQNVIDRDKNDVNRKESPLRQADDAIILDNSYMTPNEQMSWFEDLIKEKGFVK